MYSDFAHFILDFDVIAAIRIGNPEGDTQIICGFSLYDVSSRKDYTLRD